MDMKQFEDSLKQVNLAAYRLKYAPIKLVEMDLPKEIQALLALYFVYWEKRSFLDYEDFYQFYLNAHKNEIEHFRVKITMCTDCFYRGLPARIYRTWASIITQIHAGYVAESVFGQGTVEMSVDLDHAGADFRVEYKGKALNYQVKKETHSREVRREKGGRAKLDGEYIQIDYQVPSQAYFDNPQKKNGEYKEPYLRFINNKNLKRLPNGFVVFTPTVFEEKKKEIDSILP
jgi:hypothetical protein